MKALSATFWDLPSNATPLERALTPMVRGQIRSYFNDHPNVLSREQLDRAVSGISKRIVRELACDLAIARIGPLFVELVAADNDQCGGVEFITAHPGDLPASFAVGRNA